MIRNDWLMQQINRVAEAIERAFGVHAEGNTEEAFELLDDAWDGLVTDRQLFEMLDARSAVGLVEDRERLEAILRLIEAEANLMERQGDPGGAAARRLRADALRDAGAARWPT